MLLSNSPVVEPCHPTILARRAREYPELSASSNSSQPSEIDPKMGQNQIKSIANFIEF